MSPYFVVGSRGPSHGYVVTNAFRKNDLMVASYPCNEGGMFRVRRGCMPRLRLDFIICWLFDVTIFLNIRICGYIYTYLIVCVINIHNMCMLVIT